MANVATRTNQIVIGNPEPSAINTGGPNTPTQLMEIGSTGIVNFSNTAVSTSSKTNQAFPACVLPSNDPLVTNSIWINGSQVAVSGGSQGETVTITVKNTGTQTLTFVNGILTANT